jgi:hypothetical protein
MAARRVSPATAKGFRLVVLDKIAGVPVDAGRTLETTTGTNAFSMATSNQGYRTASPAVKPRCSGPSAGEIGSKFLAKVSLRRFCAPPVRPEIKSGDQISC